jgi:Domain of unknown function (DUF2017)
VGHHVEERLVVEVARSRGKDPLLKLDPQERDLMRQLLTEMRTLLEADLPRADEVTRRLFPDASDDPREAEAFRELVGDELRGDKLKALNAVDEQLEDGSAGIALEPGGVQGLLSVLTDMRLAIGTRLGVTEDTMASEPDPSDPDAPALAVLHWLGWVQETVLSEITRRGGHRKWS